jgi:type III pantothenate kinase
MLQQTLRYALLDGQARVLSGSELPLEVRTKQPSQTGIDRLLNAVAVNRFRRADHLAVVVDLGTAITVDLVNADGAFEGGAILPGLSLAARALHTGTTTLPRIDVEHLAHIPAVVGKTAGVYWGVVGAVEELVSRIAAEHSQPLQVFLTGGDAEQVVEPLEQNPIPMRHVPHLVLSGIAIAAEELQ